MIRRISAGTIIPAWYGVAWKEWHSNQAVCLPLGLNLIAAAVRNLYYSIKFAGRMVSENQRDAYAQGLRDGRKELTND